MSDRTIFTRTACEGTADCCRPAVMRAYSELREVGQPDRYAFEAALTVYRFYHPETPPDQAELVVSGWVCGAARH